MQPNQAQDKPKQRKTLKNMKITLPPLPISPLDVAKAALPIFGGTTPTSGNAPATVIVTPPNPPEENPPTDPLKTDEKKEDPIEKLSKDPNALGQLLAQVDALTKNLTTTQGELKNYKDKETEATRKAQTREQQLESDLAERDATIQKMDTVIHNMAIGNAVLNQKDVQFHSLKQVLAELNPDAFDITVDLDKGTATVTGVDHEVKRIARDFPWLVATAGAPPVGKQTSSRPPSSGGPPAPPSGDVSKQARRAELMKKFPVIATGRPI